MDLPNGVLVELLDAFTLVVEEVVNCETVVGVVR